MRLNLSSEVASVCWAMTAPPKIVRLGRRLRVISGHQGTSINPSNAQAQPTPSALAAIDRLVHHSTIFELHQVESYRGKVAAREQKLQRDNDKAQRKRQSSGNNDNQPTGNISSGGNTTGHPD